MEQNQDGSSSKKETWIYVGRLLCRIVDFMLGGMIGVESNFMFKMAIKIYRSIN